jgi:glycosyltransferase involved in cell wall biosynthesis
MNETPALCIVGPQPPPLHGVSAINRALLDLTMNMGARPRAFNTAALSLKRSLRDRLSKLRPAWRAISGTAATLRGHRDAVVYCSVSGGYGVLSELPIVRLARKYRARLVLHHHSFNYLDAPSRLMSLLTRCAGPDAIHVLLSAPMEHIFRSRYPAVRQTLTISNAAFLGQPGQSHRPRRSKCRVIGHLSNLAPEKGVFEVVDLAQRMHSAKLDFEFRVAGPFQNETVEQEFKRRTRRLENLRYLGPLQGVEKDKFFAELDAFVFPTVYRNEAEPLVLLEALAHACPVISYDRGSISHLIDSACGALLRTDEAFCVRAAPILENWQTNTDEHHGRRSAALRKFEVLRDAANTAKVQLLEILTGSDIAKPLHPSPT